MLSLAFYVYTLHRAPRGFWGIATPNPLWRQSFLEFSSKDGEPRIVVERESELELCPHMVNLNASLKCQFHDEGFSFVVEFGNCVVGGGREWS
jgi:hypothetical protein